MIPDVVRDGVECASDDTGNSHCAGVELVVARMMIQIQTQWEGTDVRDSEIARHAVRRSREKHGGFCYVTRISRTMLDKPEDVGGR